MRKRIQQFLLSNLFLALCASSQVANSQALFKDLHVGTVSSNPKDFMTIGSTMFFITKSSGPFIYRLWKSDGTVPGTVILKDSIINSSVDGLITLHNVNGTLIMTLAKNGSATSATKSELWKSDLNVTAMIFIDSLQHAAGGGSGGAPLNWTVVGSKLYFSMGNATSGRELWVTDGSIGGAKMVKDLFTGNGQGVMDFPMVAYNGKVYFQGNTSLANVELFSSDGTDAGTILVKEINPSTTGSKSSNPGNWIVYKNELYFSATDGTTGGIWKTDGTTTSMAVAGPFGKPQVFKNYIYYPIGHNLWKTDGTAANTMKVADSSNVIVGANADFLISSYLKSYPSPPYYINIYKKTDGVSASTDVSYRIGAAASFQVINNKMYMTNVDSANNSSLSLYSTDGTEAGTTKIISAITLGVPYAFNNTVFFSNFGSGTGYELWSLTPAGGSNGIAAAQTQKATINIYPNPSTGIFNLNSSVSSAELVVYNMLGDIVFRENIKSGVGEINLSGNAKGIYFYKLIDGNEVIENGKLVIK